ncbi:MAG: hypothetical protein AB7P40_05505 [Chloroflexota bacterium]
MSALQRTSFLPRPLAWFVLLALLLALVPKPALAADIRGGETAIVEAGDTLNDDLYAFGNTVDVQGTVNGDVIAGSSTVTISGTVNGDVIAAAGTVLVPGQVNGSIRATGGNLSITGAVRDDVLVGGGRLELGPEASVGRDLLFGGGTLDLSGQVGRNVRLGGGDMTVAGQVGGDVRADAGSLTVADGAVIRGDLTYSSEQSATIAPGATIAGQTQRLATPEPAQPTIGDQILGVVTGWLRMLIAMLAVGLTLLLLFPSFSRRAADSLHVAPWPSIGIGVGLLIGVPLLAVAVLVVGIFAGGWWLAPIILGLYAAALVLGLVVASAFVGQTILDQAGRRHPHQALGLLTGLVIVLALSMVPLFGWVIGLVAAIAGLGAFARTLWYARRPEPVVARA